MTLGISAETLVGEAGSQNTIKPNTLIKGKRNEILRLNLVDMNKVALTPPLLFTYLIACASLILHGIDIGPRNNMDHLVTNTLEKKFGFLDKTTKPCAINWHYIIFFHNLQ